MPGPSAVKAIRTDRSATTLSVVRADRQQPKAHVVRRDDNYGAGNQVLLDTLEVRQNQRCLGFGTMRGPSQNYDAWPRTAADREQLTEVRVDGHKNSIGTRRHRHDSGILRAEEIKVARVHGIMPKLGEPDRHSA